MRSLYDEIVVGASIAVAQGTTGATDTSAALDTMGYNTGVLEATVGLNSTAASPSAVVTLMESATSGGTYTAALANDGTTIGFTLTGNWNAGALQKNMVRIEGLGLNRKRFLKVQIVTTGLSSSTVPNFAQITLGRSHKLPTQTSSNSL